MTEISVPNHKLLLFVAQESGWKEVGRHGNVTAGACRVARSHSLLSALHTEEAPHTDLFAVNRALDRVLTRVDISQLSRQHDLVSAVSRALVCHRYSCTLTGL